MVEIIGSIRINAISFGEYLRLERHSASKSLATAWGLEFRYPGPHKRPGRCVSSPIIPAFGKFSDRGNLGASWLGRLVKSVSLGPSEKLPKWRQWRAIKMPTWCQSSGSTCSHTYAEVHLNMQVHTWEWTHAHTDAHIWTWNHMCAHTLQTSTYPNIQRKISDWGVYLSGKAKV